MWPDADGGGGLAGLNHTQGGHMYKVHDHGNIKLCYEITAVRQTADCHEGHVDDI